MDTSRKLETSGSETQGLYYSGYIRQHEFNVFIAPLEYPVPPNPTEAMQSIPGGYGTHTASQPKEPKLRKLQSFKGAASKAAQTLA